jgi:hypothetical protein
MKLTWAKKNSDKTRVKKKSDKKSQTEKGGKAIKH